MISPPLLAAAALLLGVLPAAGVAGAGSTGQPRESEPMHLDHVLLGAADLDAATAHFERASGVRAIYGGKHPAGTHNALVSLGEATYLELLAPQPGVEPTGYNEFLSERTAPTPVGWAVSTRNADELRERLIAGGFSPTKPEAGSRVTPSGETLRWRAFGLEDGPAGAPFFIEWGAGVTHPSSTSPTGCRIVSWTVAGPDHAALQRLIGTLGVEATAEAGAELAMRLELACPAGTVVYDSRS